MKEEEPNVFHCFNSLTALIVDTIVVSSIMRDKPPSTIWIIIWHVYQMILNATVFSPEGHNQNNPAWIFHLPCHQKLKQSLLNNKYLMVHFVSKWIVGVSIFSKNIFLNPQLCYNIIINYLSSHLQHFPIIPKCMAVINIQS